MYLCPLRNTVIMITVDGAEPNLNVRGVVYSPWPKPGIMILGLVKSLFKLQ